MFYIPINGRTPGIDLTGYRSASAFDLAYFIFILFLIPFLWRFIIKKQFSSYLLFWVPAIMLIPVLYVYLSPTLPYLTPSKHNVIDTRYFIIHFAVTVGVTVFLVNVGLNTIISASYLFYGTMMVSFVLLSYLALTVSPYFYYNYPYTVPFTISFPFPNQNVAAPFISVCTIGFVGAATTRNSFVMIIMALPIGFLAAALTGSRSNMILLLFSVVTYLVIYCGSSMRRTNNNARPFVTLAYVACAAAISFGLISIYYNRQPVQRALSILNPGVFNVQSLVMGGVSPSRREMWSVALSEEGSERRKGSAQDETYKVYIVSVQDGTISRSGEIVGLKTGDKYYIRLSMRELNEKSRRGMLEVFADEERHRRVGRAVVSVGGHFMGDLLLFISNTGSDRGFVTISASLDNYVIRRGNDVIQYVFSHDEGLNWYEEWYREKYANSKGVIRSNKGELEIEANEQAIRAYVEKRGVLSEDLKMYTMEYEVTVNKMERVLPMEGPARFYVGFHDGNKLGRNWDEVRNAVFVAHERVMTIFDYNVLRHERWLRMGAGGKGLAGENNTFREESPVKIEYLWQPDVTKEDIELANKYQYGAVVDPKAVSKDLGRISVAPAPEAFWSPKEHLARMGSTHNVYLDWYHYVGKLPFTLFVLLNMLLIGAFTIFVWNRRQSRFFYFYLTTGLQIIVVSGSMYGHPGIWIKYIWFIFGIAGGLMLSEE